MTEKQYEERFFQRTIKPNNFLLSYCIFFFFSFRYSTAAIAQKTY